MISLVVAIFVDIERTFPLEFSCAQVFKGPTGIGPFLFSLT
jgi:hypothetical protein